MHVGFVLTLGISFGDSSSETDKRLQWVGGGKVKKRK